MSFWRGRKCGSGYRPVQNRDIYSILHHEPDTTLTKIQQRNTEQSMLENSISPGKSSRDLSPRFSGGCQMPLRNIAGEMHVGT